MDIRLLNGMIKCLSKIKHIEQMKIEYIEQISILLNKDLEDLLNYTPKQIHYMLSLIEIKFDGDDKGLLNFFTFNQIMRKSMTI